MARFNAYDRGFVDDPYPTYARLRTESPVFFDETWDLTFFARHADVAAILRDRRFGRDVRHAVPAEEIDPAVFDRIYPSRLPVWTAMVRDSFIDLEPPRHTRIRRLVQWAFSRRASESYRPRVDAVARRAVEAACERGSMEVVADYATPIPLTMIADLLGVPPEDQPQLVEWSHAMVRPFDEACTVEEGAAAEEATRSFVRYVGAMVEDRERRPGDDLLSALVAARVDGDRLTRDEIVSTAILTLNAGHEATVQAIGNAVLALARHPGQYERLRSEPSMIPGAVDELLRYDTPLQMFERWVLEDVNWKGTELRRGTKVGLMFGSANHDEAVFTEPEGLDVGRSAEAHVSFGGGVHYCVGAPLAKVELEVALERFVDSVAAFEVSTDRLERTPSLIFRGVKELPITLDAGR